MRRFGILIPLYSLLPFGLGVATLMGLFNLFDAFRFFNCPTWERVGASPANTSRIGGYYKSVVYLQMQDGTLECNSKNGWQPCPPPIYAWDQEDAPNWLVEHFEIIPDNNGLIKQEIRFTTLHEVRYYVLLDNGLLLQCSTTLKAEIQKILYSKEIVGLLLLVGIIVFSSGWFLKIFIEEGAPVLSDWSGNIKRIK